MSYSNDPPPQQQPWGQPPGGYGYPAAQQTETLAIVALVLSIASIFTCGLLVAVPALIVANSASRAIRSSGGMKTGEGMVQAAKIISWIVIALSILGIVLTVLLIAAGA